MRIDASKPSKIDQSGGCVEMVAVLLPSICARKAGLCLLIAVLLSALAGLPAIDVAVSRRILVNGRLDSCL